MSRAIGMNWAAIAHGAEPPLSFGFLANRLERCQNFFPVRIALSHRVNFPLMLRAIWMAGFFAKTLGCGAGSEIKPTARHVYSLREQLSADGVLRGDLALRITDGNVLSDGLAVIRVVDGVGGDDLPILNERRVDLAHEPALVVVGLHVIPPSGGR
jgi:hypothetical protein